MTQPDANADQIRYWSDDAGPRWVAVQDRSDAQLRPFGLRAMEAAGLAGGERVLDVGAGCGDTTLELARRVGPSGRVHALDVSPVMLERARERVAQARLTNVGFQLADPQSSAVEGGPHDVVFSRFGVMFFDDPVVAFRRLREAARPGGRFAACCWRSREENAWLSGPMKVAVRFFEMPPLPSPHAPGPFGLFDRERTLGLLTEAGWKDAAADAFDVDMRLGGGGTLEETLDYVVRLGPLAPAMAAATPEVRARALEALRELFAPHARPEGVVMRGAAWLLTARA